MKSPETAASAEQRRKLSWKTKTALAAGVGVPLEILASAAPAAAGDLDDDSTFALPSEFSTSSDFLADTSVNPGGENSTTPFELTVEQPTVGDPKLDLNNLAGSTGFQAVDEIEARGAVSQASPSDPTDFSDAQSHADTINYYRLAMVRRCPRVYLS